MQKLTLKKLNPQGFSHVLLPALVVLLIGVIGTYTFIRTHAATPVAQAAKAPYVTLLFSRSEITASDNCTQNDINIARLDTTVAPFLQSLGFSGTGTLETGKIPDGPGTYFCTHFGDTLGASWADATNLAQNYGWSFGSHTADYPTHMSTLTPTQQNNETCGSEAALAAHNLPGANGVIAYPGGQPFPTTMQTNYGSKCFAWARRAGNNGITTKAAATSTLIEHTIGMNGGDCNDPTAPCYTISPVQGANRYTNPQTIMSEIDALKPGQWLTIEAYVLVNGSNPDVTTGVNQYTNNQTKWDCTSSDPAEHWTNDEERYCYSDFQMIVNEITKYNQNAVATGAPTITVTNPLNMAGVFGRTGF